MLTSTYQSIQTAAVPSLHTREQILSVSGASFQPEHSSPGIYLSGHTVAGYLHHQWIDDSLVHHIDLQVLLYHQSQLLALLGMVGFTFNVAKSELEPVQDIHFLGLQITSGSGKSITS